MSEEVCPCCGQHLPVPVSSNGEALLALLRRGGPNRPNAWRDVFRIRHTDEWAPTFGSWPGEPKRFSASLVKELVAAGQLMETYPGCTDCYSHRRQI